jgi:hypothetical protein
VSLVVPPAVVTQTIRGGPRDAAINRLLKAAAVPVVDIALAREAGQLLGKAGMSDVADAQVAAEVMRRRPSAILTADEGDIRRLVGNEPGVHVIAT